MAPESALPFPTKQLILTAYMSVNRCREGKRDEGILVQLEEVFIAALLKKNCIDHISVNICSTIGNLSFS